MAMYETHTGHLHTAFHRLDQRPQYIALRARQGYDFMTFDLATGKTPTVTNNGYHVAVMLEGKVYDAYTGPLGMKLADYLGRLHAPAGVGWHVVTTP